MSFWQLLAIALQEGTQFEAIKAEIDTGQPATSPGLHTYIDGKHGTLTLQWTPDTPPPASS